MAHINDNILKFTGGPTINDGLGSWFGQTAAETLNDAEFRWLRANDSQVIGTINDMWFNMLRAAGYTGSLTDMLFAYWNAPAVFALPDSSLTPAIGDGGTFVRATTATVKDFESVIREVLSDELRFQGQRRVENLTTNSEDLNGANWTAANGATVSGDGKTIDLSGGANALVRSADVVGNLSGRKVVGLFKMSGNGTMQIQISDGAQVSTSVANLTLTSEVKTYAVSHTFPAGIASTSILIAIKSNSGTATSVTIEHVQSQDKTGASDPTIPDDYVSTDVGVGESSVQGNDSTFDSSLGNWYSAASSVIANPSGSMEITNGAVPSGRAVLLQNLIQGKEYVLSAKLSAGVNSPDAFLVVSNNADGGTAHTFISFVADSSTRFMKFTAQNATQYIAFQIDGGTTGDSVLIDDVTVKDLDHGSNVDGVKCFLTTNGNSVLNNIVTKSDGFPLEFTRDVTNVCLWNRDITNAVWLLTNAPTAARDETGIDGVANTACTLTDDSSNAESHYQDFAIEDDGATHAMHIYIKQDEDETRFPEIDLDCILGTTQGIRTQINTKTGALVNRFTAGTVTSSVESVVLGGREWWKLTLIVQNNTSGNTELRLRMYAASSTVAGSFENTATGSCVVDAIQVELNQSDTQGIIFTEGSPVSRIPDIGYFLEKASTNKCTNYNANPDVALTNLTKAGDAAATLTRVLDTAELANAGLDGVCTSGYVIKIDNTAGTGNSQCQIAGVVGNLNKHSIKAYIRGGTGNIQLVGGQGIVQVVASPTYVLIESENITPDPSTDIMYVVANAGQIIYFVLNQLEESDSVTSEIIIEGSAVTRNADVLSYPATNILVNDCVFSFDYTHVSDANLAVMCGIGTDTGNRLTIYKSGNAVTARKRIAATSYDAIASQVFVVGSTYNIKVKLHSIDGSSIFVENIKGATASSNTGDVIQGTNQYIGSDWDGLVTMAGGINNFKVHKGIYTDAEVVAL